MKKDLFYTHENRRNSPRMRVPIVHSSPIPISSYEDINYLLAKKVSEKIGVSLHRRGFSRGEDEPTVFKYVFTIECASEADKEIAECSERIKKATNSFEEALNKIVNNVV